MYRSITAPAAAAAVGVLLLSGCAASPSASSEGKERVTFICTPQEEYCQGVADAFTQATGYPANYVRLSGGEAVARLSSTGDAPEFDAWFGGGAEGHLAAAEAGFIETYASPNADTIPEQFRSADDLYTGIYVGALSFCSNTDVLKRIGADAPQSWDDLTQPVFKSNVAMAHPGTSGTAYQAVWTEVELNDGDEDAALDYFAKLHPNILQYAKTGSAPGQMAGRGEVAVGVIFAQDCQKFIKEGFTNLETTFPSEGVGYEVGAVSLIKNARNEEGAKAFIDWSLTPDAQNIGATVGSYSVPTNPDATITDDMVDLADLNLVDVDIVEAGEHRNELVARFDSEVAPAPRD